LAQEKRRTPGNSWRRASLARRGVDWVLAIS
jgi:hypothetical protein